MGLTWEEYETIELAQEGEVKMRRLRPLVARFMVNENNEPLPHAQAVATLGKLPMDEVREVFEAFINAMKEAAIPNDKGRQSSLDLEVGSTTPSLTGAEQ